MFDVLSQGGQMEGLRRGRVRKKIPRSLYSLAMIPIYDGDFIFILGAAPLPPLALAIISASCLFPFEYDFMLYTLHC